MRVKIVIQTMQMGQPGSSRSEVWSGEMEILDENTYLVKMSIIAEDKPQPIVDIPFALGVGHYMWIPPSDPVIEDNDEGWNLN